MFFMISVQVLENPTVRTKSESMAALRMPGSPIANTNPSIDNKHVVQLAVVRTNSLAPTVLFSVHVPCWYIHVMVILVLVASLHLSSDPKFDIGYGNVIT